MSVFVKICGVTTIEDALLAVELGANAVGVNLVPASPRCIDPRAARSIVEAVAGKAMTVGVVADLSRSLLEEVRVRTGVERLQLHGDEPPELVEALAPAAYKAIRVGSNVDVDRARTFAGEMLLVDARVDGQLGGTGRTFDWSLVSDLAQHRRLLLAGGLTRENVARAVLEVRPWGVDVASGVESRGDPRKKDPILLRDFIAAARGGPR